MGASRWQGRPTWAEVDLGAVEENVRRLKERAGPGVRFMAVVKANAYGHGAVPVSRAALAAGADALAVACVDEALQLRHAGIEAPIFLITYNSPAEADDIARYRLTCTPNSWEMAATLSQAAARNSVILPVHVKVDTGMNRFGLEAERALELARYIQSQSGLRLEGAWTHFASADEADKGVTWEQYRRFLALAERMPAGLVRHVANSAALLDLPQMALDMVRVGIALYGLYPSAAVGRTVPLRPVLALKSRVGRLHTVAPGEGVSYRLTWRASRETPVALVPAGYADGVPRLLSNRGAVLIRGRRAPIRGLVCMDQLVVEVSGIPGVQVGDEVVLIGRQGEEEIGADEVASWAETINYEVTCRIAPRVPRIYLRGGEVEAWESLTSPLVR